VIANASSPRPTPSSARALGLYFSADESGVHSASSRWLVRKEVQTASSGGAHRYMAGKPVVSRFSHWISQRPGLTIMLSGDRTLPLCADDYAHQRADLARRAASILSPMLWRWRR